MGVPPRDQRPRDREEESMMECHEEPTCMQSCVLVYRHLKTELFYGDVLSNIII